jgi:alpha-beta hydrolase superfamily lysophospholipase
MIGIHPRDRPNATGLIFYIFNDNKLFFIYGPASCGKHQNTMTENPIKKNKIEKISFEVDGLTLQGTLHLPNDMCAFVMIGSHGFTSDQNSPKQIEFARRCNTLGIGWFRFDHRGCGASDGDFIHVTSLEGRCRDLIKAAEIIRNRKDTGDGIGLFGSSFGGAVCIASAHSIGVCPIITLAALIQSDSVICALEKAGRSDEVPHLFKQEKFQFDISHMLPALHHVLIFHGESDMVVPVSQAKEIYHKSGEPKKLILHPGGDHAMSNPNHQKTFYQISMEWLQKYLIQ